MAKSKTTNRELKLVNRTLNMLLGLHTATLASALALLLQALSA